MSFRGTPVVHPAITRPPKHASSAAAVAAAAAASNQHSTFDSGFSQAIPPPTAIGHTTQRSPSSRTKPPPPSLTPQQYDNQFPSLFDPTPTIAATAAANSLATGTTDFAGTAIPVTVRRCTQQIPSGFDPRDVKSARRSAGWGVTGEFNNGVMNNSYTNYGGNGYTATYNDDAKMSTGIVVTASHHLRQQPIIQYSPIQQQLPPPVEQSKYDRPTAPSTGQARQGDVLWDSAQIYQSRPYEPAHMFNVTTPYHHSEQQQTTHMIAPSSAGPVRRISASQQSTSQVPSSQYSRAMPELSQITSPCETAVYNCQHQSRKSAASQQQHPVSPAPAAQCSDSAHGEATTKDVKREPVVYNYNSNELHPNQRQQPAPASYSSKSSVASGAVGGTDDAVDTNLSFSDLKAVPIRVGAVISGWKAGTIIGRQGSVISSLRRECNCKISISDDPSSSDRDLTISGPAGMVWQVLKRICFLLSASGSGRKITDAGDEDVTGRENQVSMLEGGDVSEESASMSFMLAVPSSLCGCLIGRRGCQIRQFRQKYGVAFTVSSAPLHASQGDSSAERPVNISGHPTNVANCLREVCALFAEASLAAGHNQHPTTHETDIPPPAAATGGVFRSNWQRNVSGAGVHVHGSGASARESPTGSDVVSGNDQHAAPAPSNRVSRGRKASPSCGFGEATDSIDGGDEILSNSIRECSFELSNGDTEVHLLVPNDIVGCIIGRRGKTISDIREASCAFISITDGAFPPPPPPTAVATLSSCPAPARSSASGGNNGRGARRDRVILVRGPSRSVRTARYLMGSSILNAQRGGVSGNAAVATDETSHQGLP